LIGKTLLKTPCKPTSKRCAGGVLACFFGYRTFKVVLAVFGWPGLTIVTRSMMLQLRSGQLVEAIQSLGASRWRGNRARSVRRDAPDGECGMDAERDRGVGVSGI